MRPFPDAETQPGCQHHALNRLDRTITNRPHPHMVRNEVEGIARVSKDGTRFIEG
jgi:hypothetical protein